MAIKVDYQWRGITIPGAYIRVDHIRGGKRENRVVPEMDGDAIWQAQCGVYADSDQQTPILMIDVVVPFVADESPFVPLYAALKERPDMAGAVDC